MTDKGDKTPEEEQELQRLIKEIRNGNYREVSQAIEVLREKGWLTDGSLENKNLSGATLSWDTDLSNARLGGANLCGTLLDGVNLSKADFTYADLTDSSLFAATLTGASFVGTYLVNACVGDTNLSEVNFRGADLGGADLRGSVFIGTDLKESRFYRTDLRHTVIRHADLSGADLTLTNLKDNHLENTNMQRTFLKDVDLTGATLQETDFTDAISLSTNWSNLDLSRAIGLETVHHMGPGYIDIHTLYKSKGKIPEVFLRGCGVPEDFIKFSQRRFEKPAEFYTCFISYSYEDEVFARRVHDTLQKRGIRCWLNNHQKLTAEHWGYGMWDKLLFCASQHSLTGQWVEGEIETVLNRELALMQHPQYEQPQQGLITLNLDGYLFSDAYQSGKKRKLSSRQVANFTGWEDDDAIFEREIGKVIKALQRDGS